MGEGNGGKEKRLHFLIKSLTGKSWGELIATVLFGSASILFWLFFLKLPSSLFLMLVADFYQ